MSVVGNRRLIPFNRESEAPIRNIELSLLDQSGRSPSAARYGQGQFYAAPRAGGELQSADWSVMPERAWADGPG